MKKVGILFPHQLFRELPFAASVDALYLVEEALFFNQYAFHKQKIAFHRASMKAFEQELQSAKQQVHYVAATAPECDVRVLIKKLADKEKIAELHVIDPTDDWLARRIRQQAEESGIEAVFHESPMFLNTTEELSAFFRSDKKSFFQTTFYKQQRKRRNILMDKDGEPAGGKWSFDADNRKKYPKGKKAPQVQFPRSNTVWKSAVAYTRKNFAENPGQLSADPLYPFTRADAQVWFKQFLEHRFHDFGDYEDALVLGERILHHSVLSPLLNTGLLLPGDVVKQSLAYAEAHDIPINSTEGFIRQIIGWREFIRGIYVCKGRASRTTNFWGFSRKIPASFYNGSTGIEPVDAVIKAVLETGYAHHIERLMVLGNFMLLCEFDPDEVYRWFMELFIDAYDWVMVPNVYGMSQFADGGLFSTKPYISGSNYLKKMSNYPAGNWQKTWDGLFWRFIDQHRDFFKSNPRLSMMVKSLERMPDDKRREHLARAQAFLEQLDA
ncbi:MAG: cryptochrome/photolyase family protein [Pontiella sp.]|nr:cryptochrome/photolyase family protein [Pontiella sp.]